MLEELTEISEIYSEIRQPHGELVLDRGPHSALAAVGLRADLYDVDSRIPYIEAFNVSAIDSDKTH